MELEIKNSSLLKALINHKRKMERRINFILNHPVQTALIRPSTFYDFQTV